MRDIIVIAHDMRSTFNVGSLLRTAEGMGVKKVYLTGYTPYPLCKSDNRLPHIAIKLHDQIVKTSLGAEKSLPWHHADDIFPLLRSLEQEGYQLAALEQSAFSTPLPTFHPTQKIALLLGTEVTGLPAQLLEAVPLHLEIPMSGKKESFNVVIAAAMALYHFHYK
jgi:23S rRNA (guanosine2251-2'-O)-methyltransferase